MHRYFSLVTAAIAFAGVAHGAILEVDVSSPPASGSYRRITDAVADAVAGDTIQVAAGVYSQEDVPIRITANRITIVGSTVLTRDALFGFAPSTQIVHGEPGCYVHDNRIQITFGGDVPPFDYDAPECDPDASGCVPLGNTLEVNGTIVTGRSITPRR